MKESKNLRITIFIGGLGGGGAERVVCNLANYLAEKEWDICILTMSDKKNSYPLRSNIKVYPLIAQYERKNIIYDFTIRYLRLRKYIKTQRVNCFIVMIPITTLMLLTLRKQIKAKIIVSERSNPNRYSKVIKILLKIFSSRADGFVFQTKEVSEWYEPYIKGAKTIIIPNAVNEEYLSYDKSIIRKDRIIAAGRLTKIKNFSLLIRAYSKIADKHPNYRLFIFGDGPERNNLENLAKELGIENNVKIFGFTNNLKYEMQRAKLFVMPSNYEGMSNVLIEAMALGLPCIATDCPGGGSKFLIQHGINGYLSEVGNENQMASYMDIILSSNELADKIGDKAHEVTKILNPSHIYSIWETFIQNILKE